MMPHQRAAQFIKPRYPQPPRQWVGGFQEKTIQGSLPNPSLSTGIQRNFGAQWGGDAGSRFPRFEALSKAASLAAVGYLLKSSVDKDDDGPSPDPESIAPERTEEPKLGNVEDYMPASKSLSSFDQLLDEGKAARSSPHFQPEISSPLSPASPAAKRKRKPRKGGLGDYGRQKIATELGEIREEFGSMYP